LAPYPSTSASIAIIHWRPSRVLHYSSNNGPCLWYHPSVHRLSNSPSFLHPSAIALLVHRYHIHCCHPLAPFPGRRCPLGHPSMDPFSYSTFIIHRVANSGFLLIFEQSVLLSSIGQHPFGLLLIIHLRVFPFLGPPLLFQQRAVPLVSSIGPSLVQQSVLPSSIRDRVFASHPSLVHRLLLSVIHPHLYSTSVPQSVLLSSIGRRPLGLLFIIHPRVPSGYSTFIHRFSQVGKLAFSNRTFNQ